MTTTTIDAGDVEDLDSFRQRARAWLAANMPPAPAGPPVGAGDVSDEEELDDVEHTRKLQRLLYDGGFAGICFPREYGGQGLTPAHQQVLNEEIVGYDYPARMQLPTFTPCAAVIHEFGNEEQRKAHIPAILKGEEIWMQFLSEPGGGSDVAGAQTTAVRDGDEWVLNGSKIWTTGAWWSDWGLCLARTNWDVPKHRGLTVFMLRIHQPGIEVHRIEMLNGSKEFCQEFMTDVRIPDGDRIGEVDAGWTVGVRWMFHERNLAGSPYVTRPAGQGPARSAADTGDTLLELVRDVGRLADPRARDLVGEAHALRLVQGKMVSRITRGIATGAFTDQAASIIRLMAGVVGNRTTTIGFELAGPHAVAWPDDAAALGELGLGYLTRQASSIGGGTTEMARNVISERVLGMPRERAADRDVAFRDVPRSASAR
ncbi:MAG TPA: acyl-CoA dehydrogenase family protein [Acidimicrobiales bacterium]|nr:acyl-CoA dehydrogenase family protein [Acidimicrobiales bacterium]